MVLAIVQFPSILTQTRKFLSVRNFDEMNSSFEVYPTRCFALSKVKVEVKKMRPKAFILFNEFFKLKSKLNEQWKKAREIPRQENYIGKFFIVAH